VPMASVPVMFGQSPPMFWNCIDGDANCSETTRFTVPQAVLDVSLDRICRPRMPEDYWAQKLERYLLVSQDGAITLFHQDFSGTSVFYFLVKGCKTFYVIRPSANNQRLFDAFQRETSNRFFFGSHPGLDEGGCMKVVLTEGQAIVMPANTIHMVLTTAPSIALGVNFLHVHHLDAMTKAYVKEPDEQISRDACYPHFEMLAVAHIAENMRATPHVVHMGLLKLLVKLWQAVRDNCATFTLDDYLARVLPSPESSISAVSEFSQIPLALHNCCTLLRNQKMKKMT
jgi:hypothetical protein